MRILFGIAIGLLIGWCAFANGGEVILDHCNQDFTFIAGDTQVTLNPCKYFAK